MYCSKCGVQIPDDSAFCPECGAEVKAKKIDNSEKQQVIEKQQVTEQKSNTAPAKVATWKKPVIIVALSVIALILVIAAIVIAINIHNEKVAEAKREQQRQERREKMLEEGVERPSLNIKLPWGNGSILATEAAADIATEEASEAVATEAAATEAVAPAETTEAAVYSRFIEDVPDDYVYEQLFKAYSVDPYVPITKMQAVAVVPWQAEDVLVTMASFEDYGDTVEKIGITDGYSFNLLGVGGSRCWACFYPKSNFVIVGGSSGAASSSVDVYVIDGVDIIHMFGFSQDMDWNSEMYSYELIYDNTSEACDLDYLMEYINIFTEDTLFINYDGFIDVNRDVVITADTLDAVGSLEELIYE